MKTLYVFTVFPPSCGGKTTRSVDHGMWRSEWSDSLAGRFICDEKILDVHNVRSALSMDKVLK
jgi:hypothetical protein